MKLLLSAMYALFLFAFVCCRCAFANELSEINHYFTEIKSATENKEQLWGVNLYGPMLLVHPEGRTIFANVVDPFNNLVKKEHVYIGKLPNEISVANTCVSWAGKSWAMVILPLPEDQLERINLLTHELFHCAQAKLGFQSKHASNDHLNEKEGRALFA